MVENIRDLVNEINNLNSRSDLSYVGNRQFFEEYALVHNSIDQFVECCDDIIDEDVADIDFGKMVCLAEALEKRYGREYIRRSTGVEPPKDYEWEEY